MHVVTCKEKPGTPSASLDAAKAAERARVLEMTVRQRVLLALQLGDDMSALAARVAARTGE